MLKQLVQKISLIVHHRRANCNALYSIKYETHITNMPTFNIYARKFQNPGLSKLNDFLIERHGLLIPQIHIVKTICI